MLTRDGADPIIVDAAISSLKGIEAEVLTQVMQAKTGAAAADRGGGDAGGGRGEERRRGGRAAGD